MENQYDSEKIITEASIIEYNELKEELILTLVITGHGCEDLRSRWEQGSEISDYFKYNVRVYSSGCVPGINAISSVNSFRPNIYLIQKKMSNMMENETGPIIKEYAEEIRPEYQETIKRQEALDTYVSRAPNFKSILRNLDRASDLTTYLANKTFYFYDDMPNETLDSYLKESIGIHVIDVRLKITEPNGEIRYEQIFNSKGRRESLSYFNLSYKDGIQYFLKNILKLKSQELKNKLKEITEYFDFKPKQSLLNHLTLNQLYEFFKGLNISYVNIMDFTCRECSTGPLYEEERESIYREEQSFREKPVAFGIVNSTKKCKTKKCKGKKCKGKKCKTKKCKTKKCKH